MSNTGFFVVGKTLNLGFPGTVSRMADAIIENRPVDTSSTNGINFGGAVTLNASNNTYQAWTSSNTASQFAGIAVREVHQGTNYLSSYSTGNYAVQQPCDVIQRGSVTVTCTEGTPTAGGQVYLVTTAGSTSPTGSFTATASPAGSGVAVALTGVFWKTGAQDANGTAELTITSRPTA